MDKKVLRRFLFMTPKIKEIYTAVWNIHKKYFEPRTEEEWTKLIDEGNKFKIKYNNTFAHQLLWAMMAEIEERMKN